jgi:hypothetical protein
MIIDQLLAYYMPLFVKYKTVTLLKLKFFIKQYDTENEKIHVIHI